MDIARSLLKMDYLAHHKFQPRKVWWSEDMPVEERSAIEQTLLSNPALLGERFSSLGLNNRNIRKQTFITPIAVQPEEMEIGIVQQAAGYLITVFRHNDTPDFMFLEQSLSL
jgi:anaerobic magnesium-protoporphyrin IX monomethyl ester cyclase